MGKSPSSPQYPNLLPSFHSRAPNQAPQRSLNRTIPRSPVASHGDEKNYPSPVYWYWLLDMRYVFIVAKNQVYQQKYTTHVTLNFPLYPKTNVCWVKLYHIPMESQQKSMVKSPSFLMGWASDQWRSRVIVGISWVLMWETCHKPSGDEIYHLWWWLGHCFFLGLPH